MPKNLRNELMRPARPRRLLRLWAWACVEHACLGTRVAIAIALVAGVVVAYGLTLAANHTLLRSTHRPFRPVARPTVLAPIPGSPAFRYSEGAVVAAAGGRPAGSWIQTDRGTDILASAHVVIYRQAPRAPDGQSPAAWEPAFVVQFTDEVPEGAGPWATDRALRVDLAAWDAAGGEQVVLADWYRIDGGESNAVARAVSDIVGYRGLTTELDRDRLESFLRHSAAGVVAGSGAERPRLSKHEFALVAPFVAARVSAMLAATGSASPVALAGIVAGGSAQAVIIGLAVSAFLLLAIPRALLRRPRSDRAEKLWRRATDRTACRNKLSLVYAAPYVGLAGTVAGLIWGVVSGRDLVSSIGFALLTTLLSTAVAFAGSIAEAFLNGPSGAAVSMSPAVACLPPATAPTSPTCPAPSEDDALTRLRELHPMRPPGDVAVVTREYLISSLRMSRGQLGRAIDTLKSRGVIRTDRVAHGTAFRILIGTRGSVTSMNGELDGAPVEAQALRVHAYLATMAAEQNWRIVSQKAIADVLGLPRKRALACTEGLRCNRHVELLQLSLLGRKTTYMRLVRPRTDHGE